MSNPVLNENRILRLSLKIVVNPDILNGHFNDCLLHFTP
jgi:hypothetical protein